MSHNVIIGLDNGTTASVGVISNTYKDFFLVPVKKEQDYTKAKKQITRIDVVRFKEKLRQISVATGIEYWDFIVVMERPMVNPARWIATCSAVRCLEAELVILESLGIPHIFIDSKEWQSKLLPKGIKGSDEQKKASLDIGLRMFPQFAELIKSHKDADGILMAEWAYRADL